MPLQPLDLVGLEQLLDTPGQVRDDLVLALDHLRDIEARALNLDAVACELVLHMMVMLGRIEQGLGRNAADIQTGAAERRLTVLADIFIDNGHAHAELGAANGPHIAGRAGTDDNYVVGIRHFA